MHDAGLQRAGRKYGAQCFANPGQPVRHRNQDVRHPARLQVIVTFSQKSVLTLSLFERLCSHDADSFSDKLLSAMRKQFGGHKIKKG